ncbi:hypothetical protein B0A48_03542 [Cryoendolithus antarcticus]|uniref:Swi5-dependent recombination DNA repair protein 1 n=1 Tax=Cryoendolithus antarcticus TaxID=1507870 RepID=A0A1V8TKB3_9PEZI|nr:hypothetical protein B0A48_03542 [Cryoendolithus antarcticus]
MLQIGLSATISSRTLEAMFSPAPAKRRKFNKPFVSPFKHAKDSIRAPLQPTHNAANRPYTPSTLAHTISYTADPVTEAKSTPRTAVATPVRPPATRPAARPTPSFTTKRTDPAELALQKSLTTLELRIKTIKTDIDTLTTAAKYLATPDTELEDLTLKWRLASQAAAEELFGSVKERVQKMGGVEAWRESEKGRFERANGLGEWKEAAPEEDDGDCEFDSQGEELPEEEVEWRKKEKRRCRREREDAADVDERCQDDSGGDGRKEVWMEGGGDDDSFTMDMMLRTLNVELDVIGM